MNLQKVLLVDLDGTLLNVNTFHKYIFFITRYYSSKNIFKTLSILILVIFRFIRLIPHSQLKYRLLKLSKQLPKEEIHSFGQSLLKYQNDRVSDILLSYEGYKILASAAPEKYAQWLGDHFKFDATLSTKCPGQGKWVENIRENKRKTLEDHLKNTGKECCLDVVVTDHHDDLPVMELFSRVILISPSEKTLDLTRHLKEKIQIVRT